MDRTNIEPIVVGIIQQQACLTLTRELYDADLTGLGIDSLMALDIANELEDALDAVIDDREVLRFRCVNDILDYLARAEVSGA
jgi:acyl carrier protein